MKVRVPKPWEKLSPRDQEKLKAFHMLGETVKAEAEEDQQ